MPVGTLNHVPVDENAVSGLIRAFTGHSGCGSRVFLGSVPSGGVAEACI